MFLQFYKYQGAGNDFIFIDNRDATFPVEKGASISGWCDRHFGIGADGLIFIEEDENTDFRMVFFNPDGSQTMCGNGARCAVAFAKKLGIIEDEATFMACDGIHKARINEDATVALGMLDVEKIDVFENHVFVNTGTAHHVELVKNLERYPVVSTGRKLRYELYGEEGSNINFVEQKDQHTFYIRTYEKGVEDETLACGTGITAAAIAMHKTGKTNESVVNFLAKGGNLMVCFDVVEGVYQHVVLTGPARFVYKGKKEI